MLHLSVPKFLFFPVAIFWTLCIAFLCLVSFNNLPSIGVSGADKYVHFIMHMGFTGLWFLHFRRKSFNRNRTLARVAFASFCYGILIEIAQELFTTTRQADIYDVLANSSGAIAAVIVIVIYETYFKKNYN